MNPTWRVVYYESKDGRCEIREFIEACGKRDQAKLLSWIELLADNGPHLPRPYADLLEDGIHELRVTLSGDQVRCLYFFCLRNLIVLTHAFVKTTGRVSRTEIRKALKSRDDFLNRVDARQLKGRF